VGRSAKPKWTPAGYPLGSNLTEKQVKWSLAGVAYPPCALANIAATPFLRRHFRVHIRNCKKYVKNYVYRDNLLITMH